MPSKPPPPALPPSKIHALSAKYFTPFFKPQRVYTDPKPPSLAWSKLPPPAAEIDERPRGRVRRFRVWGQAAPELRVVVLDPRRRGWLVRYRSFVVPSPPDAEYGRLTPSKRPFVIAPQPFTRPSTPAPLTSPILSKKERARQHEKLLEHKWVLDMEHERRFKIGMMTMMKVVMYFQETNTTEFFKAIRKNSNNIFSYVDPRYLAPVPMRDEVHKEVKRYEKKEKKRKKKKEEKKRLEKERLEKERLEKEKEEKERVLVKERLMVKERERERDARKAAVKLDAQDRKVLTMSKGYEDLPMVRVTRSRGSPRSSAPTSPRPSRSPSSSSVFNDPILKESRKLIQELPETGDVEIAQLVMSLCRLRNTRADLLRRVDEMERRKEQMRSNEAEDQRRRGEAKIDLMGARRSSERGTSSVTSATETLSKVESTPSPSSSSPSIIAPTPRHARRPRHHTRTPSLSSSSIQLRPGSLNIDDDTALPSSFLFPEMEPEPSMAGSAISFPYSDRQRSDVDSLHSRASLSEGEDGAGWNTEADLIIAREGGYGEYGTLDDGEILYNLTESAITI
ncbi:hypothetical protein L198_01217 [Cryptococcus wingfieldii CBS 7118]|uniref:Uncharacterized protein n=1 Tax=Cryptococcus wingfieldii CBS 7118 TaxID=1295528 RepID=A0A1E3K432_9TREE|nr:hypothetical protein L198_01217 [Cryptococcus wingfieldii CBS 7118]ODO07636.1 hypothetical protein L198_01217 [Cryptococcus wingfieldii CBS 7118]